MLKDWEVRRLVFLWWGSGLGAPTKRGEARRSCRLEVHRAFARRDIGELLARRQCPFSAQGRRHSGSDGKASRVSVVMVQAVGCSTAGFDEQRT